MLRISKSSIHRVLGLAQNIIVTYCCLILITACIKKEEKSPEIILRASLLMNENHSWVKAFNFFSQRVLEESNGRILVEVFPSEQLAKESEAIRMIQAGIIDMTTTGAVLTNWIEIANFCEMPFLLENQEQKDALINGDIGKRIKSEIVSETGLRPIAYFQAGPRMLTSNRPIMHPDDLQGLIVRVPNVPSFITAWAGLGANPTPMAFSEVFTSLQQGTIEAQENPLALIFSSGFAEVQKYVNLTAHVDSWSYIVFGEKKFRKLSPDLQHIILECAKEMQEYESKMYHEQEDQIKTALRERGMEFIEVDRKAFIERSKGAIYNSLSPEMQSIYTQIQGMNHDPK